MVLLLLLSFFTALCYASSPSEQAVVSLIQKYEITQNARDADGAAALFDSDATMHLPVGDEPFKGRDQIGAKFKAFFGEMKSLKETLVTSILVNKNVAGLNKLLVANLKNGCLVVIPVVQQFIVNKDASQVTEARAVWNATLYQQQAECSSSE